jgi:hypothetical protein
MEASGVRSACRTPALRTTGVPLRCRCCCASPLLLTVVMCPHNRAQVHGLQRAQLCQAPAQLPPHLELHGARQGLRSGYSVGCGHGGSGAHVARVLPVCLRAGGRARGRQLLSHALLHQAGGSPSQAMRPAVVAHSPPPPSPRRSLRCHSPMEAQVDQATGNVLSIVTDRSQAGGSIVEGSLELMVHRRCVCAAATGCLPVMHHVQPPLPPPHPCRVRPPAGCSMTTNWAWARR